MTTRKLALFLATALGGSAAVAQDDPMTPFAPCPDSPNCVNSQTESGEEDWAIDPIKPASPDALDATWAALMDVLEGRERVEIKTQGPDYIWAIESTALFSFTDDLEFQKDSEAGVIHIRSASRVGYYDFGANRKRLEAIREALTDAL